MNPVIIIPGIGRSKLIEKDENGNQIKKAWPFELDQNAIIGELKGYLMKLLLFKKDGGFSDRVAEIVQDIVKPLSVNEDGSKKYNIAPVVINKSVAACSEDEKSFVYNSFPLRGVREDMLYYFAYDFLGDISEVAKELDKFISFVKAETGSEKVDVVAVSTAGSILKAYLKDYAVKSDCEKAVCVCAALDGASVVADISEEKLCLDNPAQLLSSLGEKGASVAGMAGMLPEEIIQNVIKKVFAVLRTTIIDNCTCIWGLIPDGRFSSVLEARDINPVLREKVVALHDYSVDFSTHAKNSGTDFYLISGYGKELPEVFASSGIQSDGLVDVKSASMGAVVNDNNEPDVTGCAFPGKTWFFKNLSHTACKSNSKVISLVEKILSGDVADVNNTDYPQFINSEE